MCGGSFLGSTKPGDWLCGKQGKNAGLFSLTPTLHQIGMTGILAIPLKASESLGLAMLSNPFVVGPAKRLFWSHSNTLRGCPTDGKSTRILSQPWCLSFGESEMPSLAWGFAGIASNLELHSTARAINSRDSRLDKVIYTDVGKVN
jgi:hypothetical protein